MSERLCAFENQVRNSDLIATIELKIQESKNEIDKLEFIAMKCILKDNYSDLLKTFGIDKVKTI